MTEHILNFSIGLDDESIKNAVKETAVKKIISDIKSDVLNEIFEARYYGQTATKVDTYTKEVKLSSDAQLKDWAKELIFESIAGFKDEIIERAADKMADNYKRSKAFKEKMEELKEE